ncbi:hypothetical protein [Pseudomonas sp. NA-150]|uniref:hypothetical protein n=1 Tax=Pseudomonas sp. NA-150 TaxID=3367525 RepID=UPI0037CAB8C2
MSLGISQKIFLCVSLTSFGGLFVCIGVALHLAYTKMDMMLEYLKNCPAVINRILFLRSGPWGRLFVLGGIIGVLLLPRPYLRDGGANAEDLKNFPADLKRKLIMLHWACTTFLLILLGLYPVVEFGLV